MGSIPRLSIAKGPQRDFTPQKLHKLFEDNHTQYPNKTALLYADKALQISYDELNSTANKFARLFIREYTEKALQPNNDGDVIIAVCMQPSHHMLTVLLAIWKSGAAYLPIDPSFPVSRVQHILEESKPVLVVCDDNVDTTVFEGKSIKICDLQKSQECCENIGESDRISEKDLAIVLYTSGSTGVPKGVRLPHSVVLNRLQWQWENYPYAASESTAVFKTALTFVDSVAEIWGPLLSGLALLIIPKQITVDPERLVAALEQYEIHRLVLVPTLLRSLLMYLQMNRHQKLLLNLKMWVCSGEPLSVSLARSFYDYFQEGKHVLYNFYGSTEVMGDVTYFVCESQKQLQLLDNIPIGKPVNNTVIYLLDEDYRPVRNGEIGEIFVAGLNLAGGYVNGRDPDRFLENPLAVELKYSRLYRTGDFGSLQHGQVVFEGRTDSQIKIRGHRVDLSEVEANIMQLEAVEKAVVLCHHAAEIDQAVLAFVKLHEDAPVIPGLQLENSLKGKLAEYMIPQVIVIDTVPLLVNGKVDRQALLKSYESSNNNENEVEVVLDYDYSSVADVMQAVARDLFETVGSVLGRSTRGFISTRSNFYELGGNSLNSVCTVARLREKGYFISISEFIAAKDLGEVLDKIASNVQQEPKEDFDHSNMAAFPLKTEDKETVIEVVTVCFYGKSNLEHWIKEDIRRTDYKDLIEPLWDELIRADLSFLVKDLTNGKVIGTALNLDARNEPKVEITSKFAIVLGFLEHLEAPIMEKHLPKGLNQIFHSFIMATSTDLTAQENIACIHFMEKEVLRVAKKKQFTGIFTTNTSDLTQQLGTEVNHYKTLLDYQVNQYVCEDGSRPFGRAPDSQRAIIQWKEIEY